MQNWQYYHHYYRRYGLNFLLQIKANKYCFHFSFIQSCFENNNCVNVVLPCWMVMKYNFTDWWQLDFNYCTRNPVLFSLERDLLNLTHHRICTNMSNMTNMTYGTGFAYPCGKQEIICIIFSIRFLYWTGSKSIKDVQSKISVCRLIW